MYVCVCHCQVLIFTPKPKKYIIFFIFYIFEPEVRTTCGRAVLGHTARSTGDSAPLPPPQDGWFHVDLAFLKQPAVASFEFPKEVHDRQGGLPVPAAQRRPRAPTPRPLTTTSGCAQKHAQGCFGFVGYRLTTSRIPNLDRIIHGKMLMQFFTPLL